jgi:hypothetical protein
MPILFYIAMWSCALGMSSCLAAPLYADTQARVSPRADD